MKLISFASLLFILSTGCGETSDEPEQVVMRFFEAYGNGDGHPLVSCLSSGALYDVNEYVAQLSETPEESAE